MRQARWQLHRVKRLRHTIKWRLVALFLLLALATTAIFLLGMQRWLQNGWQSYAKPLVADYVDKLAAEIGDPPQLERARALVARLPVSVRIEGPTVQYDSRTSSQKLAGERHRRAAVDAETSHGAEHGTEHGAVGWGLVRHTADGHRISFGLAGQLPGDAPRNTGWATLAALLLLTLLAYAYVRKMLRPLEAISAGVARFGAGEFGHNIVIQRQDELGDLATRINTMAGSLRGMLDAKRALLLAISHELRSPLTRARLNAELVPESPQRSALLRDLGAMRDLISDLLESERLASGHTALHTEAVDLAALVREVLASHFADQAVVWHPDPAIGKVQADATRVRLLLRNLLDNALRHSADAARAPELTLEITQDADGQAELKMTVRDHGVGVSDEQLAHLAEPFYRADSARQRSTGGVGLGLTLCKLVAQAHGGTLVFSRAQPGLKVVARWPLPA